MEDCSNTTTTSTIGLLSLVLSFLLSRVVHFETDAVLNSKGLAHVVFVFKSLKSYESYVSLPGIRQSGACWLETLISSGRKQISYASTFRVAYSPLEPYVIKKIQNDTVQLGGFLIELWTTLGEWLDFRTEFVEMDDDAARNLLLHSGIDVFLHPTVILPEENELFEYTIPVANVWHQLFLKQPETKVSGAAFVRAMSPGMWLTTVIAIIILSMALWATAAIRVRIGAESGFNRPRDPEVAPFEYEMFSRHRRRTKIERDAEQPLSAGSCFLSVIGLLCNQGWQDNPATMSSRLVSFSSMIFGLMIYNAYSAVLVSYLATGSTLLPFEGLELLARVRSHALCVRPGSYALSTFVDSATHQPLSKWTGLLNADTCLIKEKFVRTENDSSTLRESNSSDTREKWNPIKAMCSGRGAVLENPPIISSMAHYLPDDCHIVPIGERILPSFVSILLRSDFPYTHALDVSIVRLRSAGITDYMEKKWFGAKPRAGTSTGLGSIITNSGLGHDDGNLFVQVSLGHVGSVLFCYFGCMAIPVAVLLIEIAVFRARSRKTRKRRRLIAHLYTTVADRSNTLLVRRHKRSKLL